MPSTIPSVATECSDPSSKFTTIEMASLLPPGHEKWNFLLP